MEDRAMTIRKLVSATLICLLVAGCASIPDVTISYYFPRAETQITVTQTIGCSQKVADTHRVIRSVISVAPATANSADVEWMENGAPRKGHFHYKDMSGTFTDGDATVTLTPDGRLSGVNATSSGQGDAIVKNLITVAGAVAAFGGLRQEHPFVPNSDDKACDVIDHFASLAPPAGGDAKAPPSTVTLLFAVSIFYEVAVDGTPTFKIDQVSSQGYESLTTPQTQITLVPDDLSKPAYNALRGIFGNKPSITLTMQSNANSVRYLDAVPLTTEAKKTIEMTRIAVLNIAVTGYVADLSKPAQIWSAFVPAPTHIVYPLPIPSAPFFGKTAFGVGISDYGSITNLHYGSTSGAADASDAFGAIAKALQPQSAGDQAKVVQGQADLIAQHTRLITCQVTPTQCK
jgi:hypothetical protein